MAVLFAEDLSAFIAVLVYYPVNTDFNVEYAAETREEASVFSA
jgi:hypothetical protein